MHKNCIPWELVPSGTPAIIEHSGFLPPHREYILTSLPNTGSKTLTEQQNEPWSFHSSHTYTIAKWSHPHVPVHLRLPISPMEMRANSLTDVVVLSPWTSLMKISPTRHVCEGLTRLTTPTHFVVVWNVWLWTTSPAAVVPGDCSC